MRTCLCSSSIDSRGPPPNCDPMRYLWLSLSKEDLQTEYLQCCQEGKDLSSLKLEFRRVEALDLDDPKNQSAACALLDKTISLKIRSDYPYHEPSDLEGIRAVRPTSRPKLESLKLSEGQLFDKIYGAWLGRVAGCLLGKPVEGWRRPRLWGYLKETGQFPLTSYISVDVADDALKRYDVDTDRCFIENVENMPEDDDTNYTTIGLAIMKKHGRDFTPLDVADFWLHEMPILHTYTAERVAYRNFSLLIQPPTSAVYRNVYREWIGAQIRADFWGYVAVGKPELAAEFAWRDACVSHVKNGIYGEMWAAAMISASFTTDDVLEIIEAGLAQIPEQCRLANEVWETIGWWRDGVTYDEAVERIHSRWDESRAHDWCHTISNARIVVLAFLWGENVFGRTLTRAVQPCFDTDCNGATVGSIMGIIHGARDIPREWVEPFNDALETGISGYNRVKLSDMAKETVNLIHRLADKI